jgi:hypothetical protein
MRKKKKPVVVTSKGLEYRRQLKLISEDLARVSEYAHNLACNSTGHELRKYFNDEQIRTIRIRLGQIKYKLGVSK